ncbi:MAG: hypothetical protein ACHQJ6_08325 [Candidatus Berkiellales bacterium]
MTGEVKVVLSKNGDKLTVFIKRIAIFFADSINTKEYTDLYQPMHKWDLAVLQKLKGNFIVDEFQDILLRLVSAKNSTMVRSALNLLQSKTDELEGIHSPKLAQFKSAFSFFHEKMTEHPGHAGAGTFFFLDPESQNPSLAHDETLKDLITFINEHCFNEYDTQDKSFVTGFKYEQKKLISNWLSYYLTTTPWDDSFLKGRKFAKSGGKLRPGGSISDTHVD